MSASEDDLERFNDSLNRCNVKADFTERFYTRFMAASPAAAEKFRGADMTKQQRMLRGSLYMMISAAHGKADGLAHLGDIARRHGRSDRDIAPELYDVWLDCLLDTVRECDPRATPEVEAAWRTVLRSGIEFMKARY